MLARAQTALLSLSRISIVAVEVQIAVTCIVIIA
jgi:hypothetical protein